MAADGGNRKKVMSTGKYDMKMLKHLAKVCLFHIHALISRLPYIIHEVLSITRYCIPEKPSSFQVFMNTHSSSQSVFLRLGGVGDGEKEEREREPSRVARVAWHGSRLPKDHPKWVPRVMFSGKVETDMWPLVLARGCGRATSDHGRRRGQVSFDG